MFFQPERLTLSTINGLQGHTLFAWSWNTVLLAILMFSALFLVAFKKLRLVPALALGFLVASAMMDLRITYNHAVIAYKMEKGQRQMSPLSGIKEFSDRASEIIGGMTWGHGPLDGEVGIFLPYRLAEQRFVPSGSRETPIYWITKDREEGQVLSRYMNYYLVKKNQP